MEWGFEETCQMMLAEKQGGETTKGEETTTDEKQSCETTKDEKQQGGTEDEKTKDEKTKGEKQQDEKTKDEKTKDEETTKDEKQSCEGSDRCKPRKIAHVAEESTDRSSTTVTDDRSFTTVLRFLLQMKESFMREMQEALQDGNQWL